MIRLHWFWSTNPQKVRLALEELGLEYSLETVDLVKRENKETDYLALNPRGKVPTLEIDGQVFWESGASLLYLGQREGKGWPKASETQALNLLFFESAAFQDQAGVFFYNRVVLPFVGADPDADRVARAQEKIRPHLQLLSGIMGAGEYLLGEFSLVDLAFAPWLPVLDLGDYPSLTAWRDRLIARPSWAACAFTYDICGT